MIKIKKEQIYKGNLILVNADFPLRIPEQKDLVPVYEQQGDVTMKRKAVNVLRKIFEKIDGGDSIVPVSGYRTLQEQIEIYDDSIRENGKYFTEKYVALPNHSEHQTGLAIDLGLKKEKIDFIRPDFPYEGICQRFRKEAVRYGFIERYGREKEKITGIAHEPWHFRYVGYPHSKIMSDKNLSLEEYIEYVKNYTYQGEHLKLHDNGYDIEIFYVPFVSLDVRNLYVPDNAVYQISGNNVDGVIVTLW